MYFTCSLRGLHGGSVVRSPPANRTTCGPRGCACCRTAEPCAATLALCARPQDPHYPSQVRGSLCSPTREAPTVRSLCTTSWEDPPLPQLEKSPCGNEDTAQWKMNQIRSVTHSCPTLCDPMNRSTPGLPVHHQLPEFNETHIRLCLVIYYFIYPGTQIFLIVSCHGFKLPNSLWLPRKIGEFIKRKWG